MDARRVLPFLLMDRDGNGCHASCWNVGDDVRHEYDGTQTGHDASCWNAARNASRHARAYAWHDASQTGYDASSCWNAAGHDAAQTGNVAT